MSRVLLLGLSPLCATLFLVLPGAAYQPTKVVGDPTKLKPGGFGARSGSFRDQFVKQGGGNAASEAAVARGLEWLALHQAPDGRWSLDQFHLHARNKLTDKKYFNDGSTGQGVKNDTAGTAFGLLPFLAAGITNKPAPGKKPNPYAQTIERGLRFLMVNQKRDGNLGGGMYAHALGTIALCEAYALTNDQNLRRAAQMALNYIIAAQDPNGGGWRYAPRQSGDTSVTGFQVQALKAGQLAGLNVPRATLQKAGKFLDSCEAAQKGTFGYIGPAPKPTYTMTAAGLLCRMYLGAGPKDQSVSNGRDWLIQNYPPSRVRNLYYQYYATQVMYHLGGDAWKQWNASQGGVKGMRDILIDAQEKNGSWDSKLDPYSRSGGRIMQTSLALLTLEVYYRHIPLYMNDKK
jgi:hypothetical protein